MGRRAGRAATRGGPRARRRHRRRGAVLRTFFRDGRLTEVPDEADETAHRARADRPGVRAGSSLRRAGGERDRRCVLQRHAALRRYLVDEGFLDRDHGEYWRSGGRVDDGVEPRRASVDSPREPASSGAAVRCSRWSTRAICLVAPPVSANHRRRAAQRRQPTAAGRDDPEHFMKRRIRVRGRPLRSGAGRRRAGDLHREARERPDPDDGVPHRHVPRTVPTSREDVARSVRRWTDPAWQLSDKATNGRTNAIVTIRMVHAAGTWKTAGWPPNGC